MISLLHNFNPQPIIYDFGFVSLHWYGLLMSLAMLAAITLSVYIGKRYLNIEKEKIFDLAFWIIITGLIGARFYDVLLQLPYYINYPRQIIQVWQGGLAIHGGIIGGLIVIYFFSKKYQFSFFQLTSLVVPGLALGQVIGRWGNYFNQELFGLPTNLPWGIPIMFNRRPNDYLEFTFFHPTFLYESLGCFLILLLLLFIYERAKKKNNLTKNFYVWSTAIYVISYSLLRFFLEFIRLDETPVVGFLRWPQIISLAAIVAAILIIIKHKQCSGKK